MPEVKTAVDSLFSRLYNLEQHTFGINKAYTDFNTQAKMYADVYNKEGEAIANNTVMKPGHSIYQLGTTVNITKDGRDLKATDREHV